MAQVRLQFRIYAGGTPLCARSGRWAHVRRGATRHSTSFLPAHNTSPQIATEKIHRANTSRRALIRSSSVVKIARWNVQVLQSRGFKRAGVASGLAQTGSSTTPSKEKAARHHPAAAGCQDVSRCRQCLAVLTLLRILRVPHPHRCHCPRGACVRDEGAADAPHRLRLRAHAERALPASDARLACVASSK